VSNTTGTERTLGCILAADNEAPPRPVYNCPEAYPFAFLDTQVTTTPATYTPATPAVAKCYPAGEVTACQAPASISPASVKSPSSRSLLTVATFSKPAYNKTTLAACIKSSSWAGANPSCPAAYPVVVLNRLNPGSLSGTDAEVLGCWSASSTCADTPQPFTLQAATNVAYCVPQVVGLQTCGGFPVTSYTGGAGIYSPDGNTLIGCTQTGVNCPATFPIYFKTAGATGAGSDMRCQASVSGACSSIANGDYPVTVTNGTGSVAGCITSTTSPCSSTQVTLALTAIGDVQGCSDITTRCADPKFPFPLYDTSVATGPLGASSAKLVRCLPPQTAQNCDAAFAFYFVEVYSAADRGSLAGCMTRSLNTVCPSTAPVPYMVQVDLVPPNTMPTYAINECRPGPTNCSRANIMMQGALDKDGIPIRSADGASLLGCIYAGATTCPGAWASNADPVASSPYKFPFMLVGATAMEECRAVAGAQPPFTTSCATYLGSSTTYTQSIEQLGAANTGKLGGCGKATIKSCPYGYFPTYTGAAVTCCQTSLTCAGSTIPVFNAARVQFGCGDADSCAASATGVFGTSRIAFRSAAGNGPLVGCMESGATVCPDTTYTFAVYGTASGTAPRRRPQLSECWFNIQLQPVTAVCGTAVSGSVIGDASVAIYATSGAGTRVS
jgi:hypothetical protein